MAEVVEVEVVEVEVVEVEEGGEGGVVRATVIPEILGAEDWRRPRPCCIVWYGTCVCVCVGGVGWVEVGVVGDTWMTFGWTDFSFGQNQTPVACDTCLFCGSAFLRRSPPHTHTHIHTYGA